jgi:hypothetical protein
MEIVQSLSRNTPTWMRFCLWHENMLSRYVGMFPITIILFIESIFSSSTKKSLQNLMEKSIILHFNIAIPGSIFPALSATNLLCQFTCGILSRNIIARVLSRSKFSMSQTLQRRGGMLTCVLKLIFSFFRLESMRLIWLM